MTKEQWEKIRAKGKQQYILAKVLKESIPVFLLFAVMIGFNLNKWGMNFYLPAIVIVLIIKVCITAYLWNYYEKKYSSK